MGDLYMIESIGCGYDDFCNMNTMLALSYTISVLTRANLTDECLREHILPLSRCLDRARKLRALKTAAIPYSCKRKTAMRH